MKRIVRDKIGGATFGWVFPIFRSLAILPRDPTLNAILAIVPAKQPENSVIGVCIVQDQFVVILRAGSHIHVPHVWRTKLAFSCPVNAKELCQCELSHASLDV